MAYWRLFRNALIVTTAAIFAAGCEKTPEYQGEGPKMKFVRIPAGSFHMGSPASEEGHYGDEVPVHEVRITKPFYMGKYEVTQAQWKAVMGTTVRQQREKALAPWHLKGEGPEHPIYYVSWTEAAEFCKRLGRKFRLPTEEEWEYACRAGSQTRFYYGDDPNCSQLDQYSWYKDSSGNETHPVGQKKPNVWDLYDMHGNVQEWCSDLYVAGSNYENARSIDPTGVVSARDGYRICRGGSWLEEPMWCRSATRGSRNENSRADFVGFRVVYVGLARGGKETVEIALPEKEGQTTTTQNHEQETRDFGRAISGVVMDEAGMPVDTLDMRPLPIRDWYLRKYADGRFEVCRKSKDSTGKMSESHFVARHAQNNLAAGMEIGKDANSLNVTLKQGVILTGQVVDGEGNGIEKARVVINLQMSDWPGDYLTWLDADAEGRFEIRALPERYDYSLSATKHGYRIGRAEIVADDVRDNRMDGVSIVLPRGEFSISGVVVDTKGNPVPDVRLWCSGKEQIGINARTDDDGKFRADGIFEGKANISAHLHGKDGKLLFGSIDTVAGANDVTIVLDNKGTPPALPKGRACFPAEVGVWVNGTAVPISEVGRGWDEPGVPFGYVERIEEHEGAFECRDILLESGNRISVVGSHCFMLDSGKWVPAQDLRAGLRLRTITGSVGIESVKTRPTPYIGKVYNLKISSSNRYAVGTDGVIVRDY